MNGRRQRRKQTRAAVWPLASDSVNYICDFPHMRSGDLFMHDITEFVDLFKALSDPTRLRIVRLMAANAQELCVCELVDSLDEPQYHVSRHLKDLRDCGLLTTERDGRWVYYRLVQDTWAKKLAEIVAALPSEPFALDQTNFEARMGLRCEGRCRIGIQKQHLADVTERNAAVR